MNSLYHAAIHQLFLSLSLPAPQQEESVTSLQIGELTCHLTEHPADYLLMFTRLDAATSAQAAAQNLFSQDPCKPVLGFDTESLTPVLWSRQPLQQLDRPRSTTSWNSWYTPPARSTKARTAPSGLDPLA
ncbi:CesT family type III secretion system chaperone [Aeromonas sp. 74A]